MVPMPLAEALKLLNSSAKVCVMPRCSGSAGSQKSRAVRLEATVLRSTSFSPPPRAMVVSRPVWVWPP